MQCRQKQWDRCCCRQKRGGKKQKQSSTSIIVSLVTKTGYFRTLTNKERASLAVYVCQNEGTKLKQVKRTHTFLHTETLKCSRNQLEGCRHSSAVDAYSNLSSCSWEIMEMSCLCVCVCVCMRVSVFAFYSQNDFFFFFWEASTFWLALTML